MIITHSSHGRGTGYIVGETYNERDLKLVKMKYLNA